MATTTPDGALIGIRVLDLSQFMAGPFCTMLFGDMGADVIKVESPDGDPIRRMGQSTGRESPSFWALNRNKRSIVLDLKAPGGVEACRRLAGGVDILVENFRPGTMDRLGLGYDALCAGNPRLIYASVSGYGLTGPMAGRGGLDLIAQGESGLMSITGMPGGPPVKCGVPVCDLAAGMLLSHAILAAYIHRERTGEGQRVDTSLLEAGIALAVWEATEYFATGGIPQPTGSAHRISAPYQAFRCRDGYVTIGSVNQRNWERLCRVLGLEHLVERTEYASEAERALRRDELAGIIESITERESRAHWLSVLDAASIPCGSINTYDEVFAMPQVGARGMLQEIEHPIGGVIRQIGPAVKCSATPPAIRRPAPLLGQHTVEILEEYGWTLAEIDQLREAGVIHR